MTVGFGVGLIAGQRLHSDESRSDLNFRWGWSLWRLLEAERCSLRSLVCIFQISSLSFCIGAGRQDLRALGLMGRSSLLVLVFRQSAGGKVPRSLNLLNVAGVGV